MKDWIEFFVVILLAALILTAPMLYMRDAAMPPQFFMLPIAWCGVMYLIWDWDIF
jgi:hypothetical protein